MNKKLLFLFISMSLAFTSKSKKIIDKQGQVTFFSYTSVENIQATNNQVLSLIDLDKGDIVITMLMRAFVFEKTLMQEHFNESYIESDLFPKATFDGHILDFDPNSKDPQTKLIKGDFTLHGMTKSLEIKATITPYKNSYAISGKMQLTTKDYNIKIPPLLSPNIAKSIDVSFNFKYSPYEK